MKEKYKEKLKQKGKLKTKVTTYDGVEQMLKAFQGLFKGENTGKALVRAINEQTNWGRLLVDNLH